MGARLLSCSDPRISEESEEIAKSHIGRRSVTTFYERSQMRNCVPTDFSEGRRDAKVERLRHFHSYDNSLAFNLRQYLPVLTNIGRRNPVYPACSKHVFFWRSVDCMAFVIAFKTCYNREHNAQLICVRSTTFKQIQTVLSSARDVASVIREE